MGKNADEDNGYFHEYKQKTEGVRQIIFWRWNKGVKMGLHVTDKEVEKLIKQLGYKGCKNCVHQIEPLRMCEWAEQGGDGRIHLICPMWDKAESEET